MQTAKVVPARGHIAHKNDYTRLLNALKILHESSFTLDLIEIQNEFARRRGILPEHETVTVTVKSVTETPEGVMVIAFQSNTFPEKLIHLSFDGSELTADLT